MVQFDENHSVGDILPSFLADTESIASLLLDKKGVIVDHNPYFGELMAEEQQLLGKTIHQFVLPESSEQLKAIFAAKEKLHLKINFSAERGLPLTLRCHCYSSPSHHLILGEKVMLSSNGILQKMSILHVELANITRELQQKNRELEHANRTIKTLRGIIPICSYCKGIRDDEGYWKGLEEAMSEMTEAQFSHGVCPQCMKIHHPDIDDD